MICICQNERDLLMKDLFKIITKAKLKLQCYGKIFLSLVSLLFPDFNVSIKGQYQAIDLDIIWIFCSLCLKLKNFEIVVLIESLNGFSQFINQLILTLHGRGKAACI